MMLSYRSESDSYVVGCLSRCLSHLSLWPREVSRDLELTPPLFPTGHIYPLRAQLHTYPLRAQLHTGGVVLCRFPLLHQVQPARSTGATCVPHIPHVHIWRPGSRASLRVFVHACVDAKNHVGLRPSSSPRVFGCRQTVGLPMSNPCRSK